MNLWTEIISALQLTLLTTPGTLTRRVTGAYCGDLLSDVLSRASPGDLWITIHRHRNVVAVSSLAGLSGVVVTGGRRPGEDIIKIAESEFLPLFTTPLDNFKAAGRLYEILSDNSVLSNNV